MFHYRQLSRLKGITKISNFLNGWIRAVIYDRSMTKGYWNCNYKCASVQIINMLVNSTPTTTLPKGVGGTATQARLLDS